MEVPAPAGVELVQVETALELREAALHAAADSDVVIMAAAVADFRPADVSGTKIKKRDDVADPVINLVRNPDILRELVEVRDAAARNQLIVGFAAETGDAGGDVLDYAAAKLRRKACDLLVVNHVGRDKVFGEDTQLRSHPFPRRLRTPRGVGFQVRRRGRRDRPDQRRAEPGCPAGLSPA